ncbi:MAG: phosphohydrolase, partial [Acidobacteriota bacterium]
MDALSLHIIYPRRAKRYYSTLEALKKQIESPLRKIRSDVHNRLEHQKIPALLKDRWRPFSVAAAQSIGRGFPTLYTLEIQVDRTMDAYLALGLLHSLYPP